MLLVFFLILLGVTLEEVRSDVFNDTSGHFSAKTEDLKPNTTWTIDISPVNATHIFVVLEEVILDDNDLLSIYNGTRRLNETRGTHDPFSFLFEGDNVTLVLKVSADDIYYRALSGYYTISGCTYQLNETYGKLSTPQLYIKNDTAYCNFSVSALPEITSKVSVTFLKFQLNNNSKLHIIANETYNYTGSSIPPEIISEKMELSFMLHKNDIAMFIYEHVLKESEYIVLDNSKQSHNFSYLPSPEKMYYPNEQECHWVIQSDENTTISFEFFNVSPESGSGTYVFIKDGKNYFSAPLFYSYLKEDLKYRYISSSGNFLWISIEDPEEDTRILATARMHKNGGYKTGNGKLSVPSKSTKVVYLVEEELDEDVVLSQHSGTLTSNSTIYVYDDFSVSSVPIAVFNASLPSYPIVSSTSKMMVMANNFGENATYEASYEAVKEGCYEMSATENGQYGITGNCNATCKWIVPPVKAVNKVISLHLYPIKLEKHDVITLNLLDAKQTMIAKITSNKELPEFYLPLSSGFLLNSVRGGNCSTSPMLHATFEKKQGCSAAQELTPGTSMSVESPNFPDTYPFWAHCWTNITATKTTKNVHFLLTFNKIDLAATHCLRIRSNVRNSSEVIKTYEGTMGALPGDLITNGTASVEFMAQPCNSTKKELPNPTASSGFHLDILSADCGGKFALKGNFSTPDFPKNTSVSICIWLLEVPEKEIINFTLSGNIATKDVEFKIYDGPSIHNETMKNHSALTLLSRTNSLIFIYRRNSTISETSPGIQVIFHSQACPDRCQNGLCLHDDWKCNEVNDCGDNTDEIGCKELPPTIAPVPPPEKCHGVSSVALGLGILFAFIVGVLATIYLPPLIRRFRSGRYHQFRDVSADA